MSFPTSEDEAIKQGYSPRYVTTCLRCGERIRMFRTPRGKFMPVDVSDTEFKCHFDSCNSGEVK